MASDVAAADDDDGFTPTSYKRYALTGKVMLAAIIALFFVVILMICLHLYVRLYLLSQTRRQSRRHRHRRHRRRPQFVFTAAPRTTAAAPSRGLPQSVLKSLPVFVHSVKPNLDPNPIYCAVCLSEFEENEMGRVIPKCSHSFHVGCIDMWFYSHVTCPLCRSEVKPELGSESRNNPVEVAVDIHEPDSMSVEEEPGVGNPVEVALPVEMNDESREVDDMSDCGTSRATANIVKSLSLKRILCGDVTERGHENKKETEAVGPER